MSLLFTPNASVATVLTLLVTLLIPIAVGVITKVSAHPGVKAVVLIILSALTAIGSNLLAVRGTTDVWPLIQDTVFTAVIAIASYFGVWKPTTIAPKVNALPGFIG